MAEGPSIKGTVYHGDNRASVFHDGMVVIWDEEGEMAQVPMELLKKVVACQRETMEGSI